MATKDDLLEQIAEMSMALQRARANQRALRRKNRRLRHALLAEGRRFKKLSSYVERLRDWAQGLARQTSVHEVQTGAGDASKNP